MARTKRAKPGPAELLAKKESRWQDTDPRNWNFETCPKGLESECFDYEYARQTPWILAELFFARVSDQRFSPSEFSSHGFDTQGFWHFGYSSGKDAGDWGISLVLRNGFPEKPFLAVADGRKPEAGLPLPEGALWPDGEVCSFPPSSVAVPTIGGECIFGSGHKLFVDWQYSDDRLLNSFAQWLKDNRPYPPRAVMRGRGKVSEIMADLKALGALRLLNRFTASEAIELTQWKLGHPLYRKLPDWYEAAARARRILEMQFRWEYRGLLDLLAKETGCSVKSEWI